MPRIEGSFAIYPSDDGLLVLVPEGDEPVRYWSHDDSGPYRVVRELEGFLTLRPDWDTDADVYHLGKHGASRRKIETTKVQ